MPKHKVSAKVWLYPGDAAWHFVTIPKKLSATLSSKFQGKTRGWGSIPVNVALGKSKWKTSIFPDKKSGTFLLPLKAHVRKAEGIYAEDTVSLTIEPLL